MKKTIKEELNKEYIIYQEYLDDNSLLKQRLESNGNIEIVIQYIENSKIQENYIMTINNHSKQYYQISEDNSAIAVYQQENQHLSLQKVYDVKRHRMIWEEYADIFYEQKFQKQQRKIKQMYN